jgi:hypothetical protein
MKTLFSLPQVSKYGFFIVLLTLVTPSYMMRRRHEANIRVGGIAAHVVFKGTV